jgi:hypothetical protein
VSPARRLAVLAASLLVALGLTSVSAEAGLPVPVNCAQSPVELRWDDVTYDLNGTCGVVKVLADDVTVQMPTATRLVVRGHRNTVIAKTIGSVVLHGADHDLRTPSVRTLKVASPGSRVAVAGLVEHARLGGHRAIVTAERVLTLRAPGRHHTLRADRGVDATVGGDANTVRYLRLDALVVTGDDNSVRVRRGETGVRNDGRGNRITVARRG